MSLAEFFGDIADAIREKDGTTDPIDATDFPTRIRAIQTRSKPGIPLDPVQVYRNTRPADWLPMPEPQDNEMYLLFHIPDGLSSLLAFTVTCTGSYAVDLGTVSQGQFVQQSTVFKSSGDTFEAELRADDYGGLTTDGMKQVMIKVSGTDILTWKPSTHSKKTAPAAFCGWNIVEISCNLPTGTSVNCTNFVNIGYYSYSALYKIRYFTWIGTNNVTTMESMFHNCRSLTAVPELDTSNVTSMDNMFNACYSLTAVPELDTSLVTSMIQMFYACYSLTAIPKLNTSRVKRMHQMFYTCYSLTAVPELDTSLVTSMAQMFYACYSLTAIPELDASHVPAGTSSANMFNNCYSLASLLFSPSTTGWAGFPVNLKDCSFGHQALVNLFNSLPTITSARDLTLTGNPGVSELTAEEKAIATGKNWTLAL